MTTEKVNDLEIINLADYFDPKYFRLVPADLAHIPGGISEVPVHLNIHPDFAKHLTFDTNNLQHFFAFAIMGKELRKINKSDYYSPERSGFLKMVELNDCGDLWIIKFEFFDDTKKLYAVKMEDVPPILNNCRKPLLSLETGF
ncbi:MAG: hypothetical protein MJ174_02220 [Treponema sp.]|nr:hypothetical protein [Treponema sp.]